jgi:transcription-repair coupling factor (superfamily II helicase)
MEDRLYIEDKDLSVKIGLIDSFLQKPEIKRNFFFIFTTSKEASQAYLYLRDTYPKLVYFPGYPLWGASRYQNPKSFVDERTSCLGQLALLEPPYFVITSCDAIGQYTLGPDTVRKNSLLLENKQDYDLEWLENFLKKLRFKKNALQVSEPGQYSIRGGIWDIFSPIYSDPLRVEFFGDTVESLRYFKVKDQKSFFCVEKSLITPCEEIILAHDAIRYESQKIYDSFISQKIDSAQRAMALEHFLETGRFHNFIYFEPLFRDKSLILDFINPDDFVLSFDEPVKCAEIYLDFLKEKKQDIQKDSIAKHPTFIWSEYFAEEKVLDFFSQIKKHFEVPENFSFELIKKNKPYSTPDRILNSLIEMGVGDYVVYEKNGIGRIAGIKNLSFDSYSEDFLVLEYDQNDKVYVPLDHMDLVKKSLLERLDKLKSPSWSEKKEKARQEIERIAASLVIYQAKRSLYRKERCLIDGEAYNSFIKDFPYQETTDQLAAIEDVERDLLLPTPMDRIIVGEVGYGKTEVAMRAAMATVLSHQQVLVLVPTTVLSYQHHKNFSARFEKQGVFVAQIHRMIKPKDQAKILKNFAMGTIDILIGTHRLLGPELAVKNLGLVVIDEEHRFGVAQKERLKELSLSTDLLTLTATPIPRTLHMGLLGLKEISFLREAPYERKPVQTFLCPFDKTLIKNAIFQEAARGGQVFFVHNRIEDMEKIANLLKALVSPLKVVWAHGQMEENKLEKILFDFMDHRFQVLVCTTIIESGIDIPNANTILINRADQMGLTQLYQLRGRVGRSHLQAYAYLITDHPDPERLEVFVSHGSAGSGLALAHEDLKQRGAGNLLGLEQSGHMDTIGYDLYLKMLTQEMRRLKGEEEKPIPTVKLQVSAFIPSFFVPLEKERLALYRKVICALTQEELLDLKGELIDRYGSIPPEGERFFDIQEIKNSMVAMGATSLLRKSQNLAELAFHDGRRISFQIHQDPTRELKARLRELSVDR